MIPSDVPRWASVGGGAGGLGGDDPGGPRKDTGWLASERPPAEWFNWLFYTIYLWILYLQSRTTFDRQVVMSTGFARDAATWTYSTVSTEQHWDQNGSETSADYLVIPLPVEAGDRILDITATVRHPASSTVGTITMEPGYFDRNGSGEPVFNAVGVAAIDSAGVTTYQTITTPVIAGIDVVAGREYVVRFYSSASVVTTRQVMTLAVSGTVRP